MPHLLIIEDELVLAHQLAVALESSGHEVALAGTAKEGLDAVRDDPPELALVDLRLPDGSGLDLIREIQSLQPSVCTVLMTAYGSEHDAITALRLGAAAYLTKPLEMGELSLLIERLLRERNEARELEHARRHAGDPAWQALADSEHLRPLFDTLDRLYDGNAPQGTRPPILLAGPRGSGRRAVARAIHERLGGGPYLEVEATDPEDALEHELFGVDALADGHRASAGLFEAARGGTLVIHNAASLSERLRSRMLRTATSRKVQRTGGRRERPMGAQLLLTHGVAGTEQLPAELAERIRGLGFELPPLRERPGDILALARHHASRSATYLWAHGCALELAAEGLLLESVRPDSVLELRSLIERAVIQSSGSTTLGAPALLAAQQGLGAADPQRFALPEEGIVLEDLERDLLLQALERTDGNQTRAASLLGVSRDTLRYRAAKLGL